MELLASLEVIQLLERLFEGWEAWDQNKYFYLGELLPELKAHPENGTKKEKTILKELKQKASEEEWNQLEEIAENLAFQKKRIQEISRELDKYFEQNSFTAAEKYISIFKGNGILNLYEIKKRFALHRIWGHITSDLELFKFEKAEHIYNEMKQHFTDKDINEYKRNVIEKKKAFIQNLVVSYDFKKADEVYSSIQDEYPEDLYHNLVLEHKGKQERAFFISSLKYKLSAAQFSEADDQFSYSKIIDEKEYIQVKTPYIRDYVQKHFSKAINSEKAEALANINPNILLSARAGSGKTTVLACKASMLINCEKVHPDQILVLAFNQTAAKEIQNRIHDDYDQQNFENARTFHSFAHQIVQPTESLLYDIKDNIVTRKMSLLVQQLVKDQIHNPVFIEMIYAFFRKEMMEIERAGFLLDDEAYFDFRRNLLQVTLNGEKVKSVGEKIIADFLFEHDLSYGYEKVWLWGSQIYRPDFSIYEKQKDFVIEFWGLDEDDPNKKVPEDWSITWDEYIYEMQAKRRFWEEKCVTLIETSIRDLRNGREAFEEIIEKKLYKAGINKPKLSPKELITKIKGKDYAITRLCELFTQFIQRAKKKMLKADDVQNLIRRYHTENEREVTFIDLACRVYMEYEKALTQQHKIDFDDLMMRAIDKIQKSRGECELLLGKNKNRAIQTNDLKWILIDEYQDFSELFYELINAIKKYNPGVKLFCVGDDWQAINGFAGSDLKYFTQFSEWVDDSRTLYLSTNFRSQAAIVKAGNALMNGRGKPGEPLLENNGGKVFIKYMDDEWVEFSNKVNSSEQRKSNERFLIRKNTFNGTEKGLIHIIASKYLKMCYEIILENKGKTTTILSRTNWIDGVNLEDFKTKLINCFSDQEKHLLGELKLDVQTAHKYKGLEADLVIIIGACNGSFPLLHPDNALFKIFGKTLEDAFEEERRLFYVALTRAKSTLYIISEKGLESPFLNNLPAFSECRSKFNNVILNKVNGEEEIIGQGSKYYFAKHDPEGYHDWLMNQEI